MLGHKSKILKDLNNTKYALQSQEEEIRNQQEKAVWEIYQYVVVKHHITKKKSVSKKKSQGKLGSTLRWMKMKAQHNKTYQMPLKRMFRGIFIAIKA